MIPNRLDVDIPTTTLRIGAAIVLGVTVLLAFAATAAALNGLVAALAFVTAVIVGAGVPLTAVSMLKDDTPGGGLVAPLLAILAQYVFGRGAVVRREDGGYEWTTLRESDEGYRVELADGTEIDVEGDRRTGRGRPLALLEEHGANVEQFAVEEEPPETAAESTRERRAGMDIHHPSRLRDETNLISMKKLAQSIEGSAGSQLTKRGRAKALEEAGGQQAISTVWLVIITGAMSVLGFGMGFVALSL